MSGKIKLKKRIKVIGKTDSITLVIVGLAYFMLPTLYQYTSFLFSLLICACVEVILQIIGQRLFKEKG